MVRAPLAILNELSVPDWTAEGGADCPEVVIADFVGLLRRIRGLRRDIALVTHQQLGSILVDTDGMTLAARLSQRGGVHRERWRFIQNLRNHAPFSEAPALRMADGAEEYRWQDQIAEGLGLAAANRQLAVSMVPARWLEHVLTLDRCWLRECDSGELEEQRAVIDVVHVAAIEHVDRNADFIRALALPEPFSGADMWADRVMLYPNLRFTDRVADQLARLSFAGEAIDQVSKRLSELQESVATWNPASTPAPQWATKVTPEGEQSKKHCWFPDVGGERRCFDLHARFTPGAGRIHFRLAPEDGKPFIVIAHIGSKLY